MRIACVVLCCGVFAACGSSYPGALSPSFDSTMAWPSPAVGPYLVDTAEKVDGFESGDLTGWGAEGAWVSSETQTGIAQVVNQGQDFAIRLAEDRIVLLGDHALALQVTEAEGVAAVTSDPFVPSEPHLLFAQLSEVDARGGSLQIEVIEGCMRTRYEVPPRTGGHRPGLVEGDERIESFPEVGYDGGVAGTFTYQAIDLTSFHKRNAEIRIRFVQRSLVEPFDFFTLLDDICVVDIPDAYLDDIELYVPTEP